MEYAKSFGGLTFQRPIPKVFGMETSRKAEANQVVIDN